MVDQDEQAQEAAGGTQAAVSPAANRGRWVKGTSGNPAGRPLGSRNRATVVLERWLDGDRQEELTRKLIALAKAGNATALRFLLGRVVPRCRRRTIQVELPELTSIQEVSEAMTRVFEAVTQGRLTLEAGERLTGMLVAKSQSLLRPKQSLLRLKKINRRHVKACLKAVVLADDAFLDIQRALAKGRLPEEEGDILFHRAAEECRWRWEAWSLAWQRCYGTPEQMTPATEANLDPKQREPT